jgi:hypothetical protein
VAWLKYLRPAVKTEVWADSHGAYRGTAARATSFGTVQPVSPREPAGG